MNRLSTRLMLAFVSMTLLTVGLLTVPQLRGLAAERGVLPEAERPVITAALWDRALSFRATQLPGRFEAVLEYGPEHHDGVISASSAAILRERIAGTQATAYVIAPSVVHPLAAGVDGAGGETLVADGPDDDTAIDEATIPRRDIVTFLRDSLERRAAALIGSASLALVLSAALALLLARLIARPVESVTKAATRVADGDLSVRIPLQRAGVTASETSRLAQSFNAMADSLERSERTRKDMVADVAHELRTPLTVMRGRLEAMEDGVTPLDLGEVRDLHAQVLVLTRLVEDLRTLSLADAGQLSLQMQRVDLSALARSVVSAHTVRARERDVALTVTATAEVITMGDPDRLTQVMVNLLDNALRHTPAGGSVELHVGGDADGTVIEVRDSGPGIPPGEEQRIFDRFVRTDSSRARSGGGTGLGLAIVNTIVALHDGTVRAWNSSSGGAVFTVRLGA